MPPLAAGVAARVPWFYGWVIVGLGGLAGAVTMGLVQSYSVFLPPLQRGLGASRAMLSDLAHDWEKHHGQLMQWQRTLLAPAA